MNFLNQTMATLFNTRPKVSPATRNRIDADPILISYHESRKGPKPPPHNTSFLPVRTRIIASPFSDIAKAQSEAYYEEIDTISAASLGLVSEYSQGHWYVVHPVTYYQVRGWSNKVLQDLAEWIEVQCPNGIFTRKAKQILEFKNARDQSLEEVGKELKRREKRGEVGLEEGYTGDYEVVGGTEEEVDEGQTEGSDGWTTVKGKERQLSGHTQAALEEAAEAGRKAAREARLMDGWHVEH
jgi:hypothetical protein